MRLVLAIILLPGLLCPTLYAQDPEAARELTREGVRLHEAGSYEEAIKQFNAALKKDKDNFHAMAEKANTLEAMGSYEDCIALTERALQIHGANEEVSILYLAQANALDKMKKPEEALAVYKRGQERSPNDHQLWYNEGVTLAGLGRNDEAKDRFEHAIRLAPEHAGSHNALGRLAQQEKERIPALLALSRCLILESTGQRARGNLSRVQDLMKGNAERTGENSVTVHVDSAKLASADQMKDSFVGVELVVDMMSAMDLSAENRSKPFVELFQDKFDTVCGMLDESKAGHEGFFWDYYAPYFAALKNAGHVEAAVMVMHRSSAAVGVQNWLLAHKSAVVAFEEWTAAYEW